MNCDGHMNLPDGEICTSPVEASLDGTIRFTYPAIYQGREVEDVTLTFQKGRVVEAHAAKGEGFFREMLAVDPGAKMVGEFAIGTNEGITRFTKDMLFDEKLGGTIHLALGAGLPEVGGANKSGIHWDILKDMKEGGQIYGNGELLYENGGFVV
jgi:aminopeptidase